MGYTPESQLLLAKAFLTESEKLLAERHPHTRPMPILARVVYLEKCRAQVTRIEKKIKESMLRDGLRGLFPGCER